VAQKEGKNSGSRLTMGINKTCANPILPAADTGREDIVSARTHRLVEDPAGPSPITGKRSIAA